MVHNEHHVQEKRCPHVHLAPGHLKPQFDDRLCSRVIRFAAKCPGHSDKERGAMSRGHRGEGCWISRPRWWSLLIRRWIRGCVPIYTIEGSHSSASRARSTQEKWRGGSTRLSNFGFRRSNAVFILDMEQWTSSIPSTVSLRVCGSLPNQSTCVLWTWRRHSIESLREFCGGFSGIMCCRAPLCRLSFSLYSISLPVVGLGSGESGC